MNRTTPGGEAIPPEEPDPPNVTKNDFPYMSKPKKVTSNNMKQYENPKYTKYLEVDFDKTERNQLDPYRIKDEIEKSTGEKLREVTGSNKFKLTLQTRSAQQTSKCLQIKELALTKCKITPHPRFNISRGLIRLKQTDIDDMQEFKEYLQTQYDVETVEKATFIRSKYGEIAYIVTFNLEKVPYSLYIPGENNDTVVNRFKSNPMMCKKCQDYGHTAKGCKKTYFRCRKCSEEGHEQKDCTAETSKCHHCSEDHVTGFKDCPKQQKEQEIVDLVEEKKVTFQRARQIANETPINRTIGYIQTPPFAALFDVTLPKGIKRHLKPWSMNKYIENHIGKPPLKVRGKPNDLDTYIIEVSSAEESRKMSTLRKIGEHDVTVQVNVSYNVQKGLVFIQGYDMLESESYKESLKKHHDLASVEHATWIKSRNNTTQALILGFQRELPNYLDIPGESMRTLVHEYKQLPNLCRNCLEYGHSKRICQDDQKCTNCTSSEHQYPPCNNEAKCNHCPQSHKTGDKSCQRYKVEQEVLAIQAKSKVSRNQAQIIHNRDHPNATTTNYAAAVTMTPADIPLPVTPPTSINKTHDKNNKPPPKTNLQQQVKPVPVSESSQIPTLITSNRFNNLVDDADGDMDDTELDINIVKDYSINKDKAGKRKPSSSPTISKATTKAQKFEKNEAQSLDRANRSRSRSRKSDKSHSRHRSRSKHRILKKPYDVTSPPGKTNYGRHRFAPSPYEKSKK